MFLFYGHHTRVPHANLTAKMDYALTWPKVNVQITYSQSGGQNAERRF